MECVKNCKLCDKFILSQSITFSGNSGVFKDIGKCPLPCRAAVVAGSIPTSTTASTVTAVADSGGEYYERR